MGNLEREQIERQRKKAVLKAKKSELESQKKQIEFIKKDIDKFINDSPGSKTFKEVISNYIIALKDQLVVTVQTENTIEKLALEAKVIAFEIEAYRNILRMPEQYRKGLESKIAEINKIKKQEMGD